ncbi:MAG: hypothetical protein IJY74_05515 [Oscillospiraceae bacterium]|nr:hypothetical protein [Oscillospiraceae bacterium]
MSVKEGTFFAPPKRSFPVTLGEVTFFVQSWHVTGQRIFSEQAAADGACVITNTSQRCRKVVLEGIWVTDTEPDSLILLLDSFIDQCTAFEFTLRQMYFEECRLMKYTAEEKGEEPYIKLRLELFASVPPKEADVS